MFPPSRDYGNTASNLCTHIYSSDSESELTSGERTAHELNINNINNDRTQTELAGAPSAMDIEGEPFDLISGAKSTEEALRPFAPVKISRCCLSDTNLPA